MGEFSEELYLEIMSMEDPSYDNTIVEEAYTEAFIEDIWR